MKRILYLGTDPTHFQTEEELIHYPIIKILPRSKDHPEILHALRESKNCTHFLFTSKNAVPIFCAYFSLPPDNTVIAIGPSTAVYLKNHGMTPDYIAKEATQEGVIALLETLPVDNAKFFLPRSSLSRPALTEYFEKKKIAYVACDLYDTLSQKRTPLPDLNTIDEIVFTSPSTVRAFVEIFGFLPKDKKLQAIGPITAGVLGNLSQ